MNLNPSKLNHHLFSYNLSDNPFCPNCFDYIENVNHYFFKCVVYSVYRNQMIIIIIIMNFYSPVSNTRCQTSLYNCLKFYNVQPVNYSEKEITEIILNGIKMNDFSLQYRVNHQIFQIVRLYIKSTNRFVKSYPSWSCFNDQFIVLNILRASITITVVFNDASLLWIVTPCRYCFLWLSWFIWNTTEYANQGSGLIFHFFCIFSLLLNLHVFLFSFIVVHFQFVCV